MNNGERPFHVRDCALISLATGLRAHNLREFQDGLSRAPESSIYHHFWGRFLQPRFDEPEYNNDFAAWAYRGLHEKALAERLSVLDPTEFEDIESLRQEVLERVEERLDENEFVPWARSDQIFFFTQSQIIVLDTGRVLNHPSELADSLPELALGSVFYHFIDARRRTMERIDDFTAWLEGWGEEFSPLCQKIMTVDPYFSSLKEIRNELTRIFRSFFSGGEK